jgi:2-polyprenyl-3-methyl-5-hydroxy-6-metoxy-1,4-benzoquinol methylase
MDILFSILLGILSLVWLLDGLRLRQRAKALVVIEPNQGTDIESPFRIITKRGAVLSESMVRSATQYALVERLDVLGLVADDLPAAEAMLCMQAVDPKTFRKSRMAFARMLGEAFLVRVETLERMGLGVIAPKSGEDFLKLAAELKKYSSASMDFAVMAGLKGAKHDGLALRPNFLKLYFGSIGAPWLFMQVAILTVGLYFSPFWAAVAFAAYIAQPLLVLVKTPSPARDLWLYAGLRPLLDTFTMIRSFFMRSGESTSRTALLAEKRQHYKELLSQGIDSFFEERREDCPLCKSKELTQFIRTQDRFQFKPGEFQVDRCRTCAHIFQNPRLSISGLDFYYKDFYDGLGEERLEGIFSHGNAPYLARARMLEGKATPSRWLDVGGGHGHFCLLARDVFPEAAFDGLDLSSSVLEAEKKGWTNRSYRGLFPELADQIAQTSPYDVISMSHYLEHTRDPSSEIEAASKVLSEGGHLLIELPDPESRFGRIFRSFWIPWFQPQHQHFLSAANLERLLKAHKFEPVTWHRGEAHHPIDIMFSIGLMVTQIARPFDLPWLPQQRGGWRKFFNPIVFVLAVPFLAASRILDLALAPLLRRPGWANAYRVLAVRVA